MPRNSQLSKAKKAKNDDFYTSRKDIEDELCHYEDQFRDKVVYCNCDDPEYSEFWKFFMRNFVPWGLKKLIATHYDPNEKNYAYMLEMTPEIANGGGIAADSIMKPIQSNGDFRSAACIELLEEADIVVSNPPFSKFREYVNQLIQYNKKFLIMGNMNAITYKEIFPLIKDNKMWPGYGFNKTMEFIMPDDYELKGKAYIDDDGKKHGFVPAICWYTNLDVKKRHEPLDLRGTYYSPERYPKYDNYDAIEVGRVSDIPCDYFEEIGVPITFLSKYNPDQFELIGADFDLANPEPLPNGKTGNGRFYVRERESTAYVLTLGHSKGEVMNVLTNEYGYSSDELTYVNGVMGVPITFLSNYCPEQFEIIWQASGNSYANAPRQIIEWLKFNPEVKYGGGLGTAVLSGKAKYSRFLIRRVIN